MARGILLCAWLVMLRAHAQPLIFPDPLQAIGVVRQEEGVRRLNFAYTYTGEHIIYLKDVQSACHCVGADREHLPVLPQEDGVLVLHFLPSYHVGVFEEEIQAFFHPSLSVTLVVRGEVIPITTQAARYFPFARGELLLPWQALHMGTLRTNRLYARSFPVYNASTIPMRLEVSSMPHLEASFAPSPLPPGQVGSIIINYHPLRRNALGYALDTLRLHTDDIPPSAREIYVAGTILEGISVQKHYARLLFEQYKKALNKTENKHYQQATFSFRNAGEGTLEIREISTLCDCLHVTISGHVFLPHETGHLDVQLDTRGQNGKQRRSVLIFSNDPIFPMQSILVEGRANDG